ncbi:hypothetical protein SPRG_19496 [Saprolegnia parasitica CBS 223.65]|uniref:Disease resistance R13L4/SHOC-2-like LRR domain-containing protein n=1 Tax=Saprolegnia parasitica (strain CBS 223.65) TaxID=695850 RepID=A0A067CYB9_SAPPC|nr:hypothetical protein SPRG_19496 [Saprolegnia parasitica CBS 223.65]KDO31536.1 hypothetical protein SPRG_19496 [Saprolegnia parasitica CBS 223.65]|eukprot:XP_012197752.1 hypothetical protein SPRG_19496 [Saprolegnia parasitica CBS 223.65]
MQRVLRQSRQSGTLNLTSRDLTHVPAEVLFPLKHLEADEKHWECIDLYKLDLSYNQLRSLPEALRELAGLKWLKVKDNQLTRLPASLGSLQLLVYLDVSDNRLNDVPEFVGDLLLLRELCVTSNTISTLPSSLGRLEHLETLRLDNNHLTSLPEAIGRLTKLRVLTAQSNQLASLPSSFANLSSLSSLDLSKNNLGATVVVLDKMAQLEFVDLRNNGLSAFPSLPTTTRLDHLLLGNNKLTSIDNASLRRVASSLTVLNIHDNQLAALSADLMSQFAKLKTLDLSNNNLSDLPYVLGHLGSLNHILVEGNPLRSIRFSVLTGGHQALKSYLRGRGPAAAAESSVDVTESLSEVDADPAARSTRAMPDDSLLHAFEAGTLDLTKKQLAHVPVIDVDHICATLVHLNLSRNLLTELPAHMGSLMALQTLTAEENLITRIDPSIGALPRLQFLRLKRNRLNEKAIAAMLSPATEAVSMLKELDLRNNAFTHVPHVVVELPVLDTLLLSFNKITTLDGVAWAQAQKLSVVAFSDNKLTSLGSIHEAKHLTSLSLENNNLLHIPPELGLCEHLRALVITGNPQRRIRFTIQQKGSDAVLQCLRDQLGVTAPVPVANAENVPPPNRAVSQRNISHPRPAAGHESSAPAPRTTGPRTSITPPQRTQHLAPVARSSVAPTAKRKLDAEPATDMAQLLAKIHELEVQVEECSLSNAKRYAVKKELAMLRSRKIREDRKAASHTA